MEKLLLKITNLWINKLKGKLFFIFEKVKLIDILMVKLKFKKLKNKRYYNTFFTTFFFKYHKVQKNNRPPMIT